MKVVRRERELSKGFQSWPSLGFQVFKCSKVVKRKTLNRQDTKKEEKSQLSQKQTDFADYKESLDKTKKSNCIVDNVQSEERLASGFIVDKSSGSSCTDYFSNSSSSSR